MNSAWAVNTSVGIILIDTCVDGGSRIERRRRGRIMDPISPSRATNSEAELKTVARKSVSHSELVVFRWDSSSRKTLGQVTPVHARNSVFAG